MEAEREAAEKERRGFIAKRRYRPVQWDDVRDWRTYADGGERWFGFDNVRSLDGLPPEILMVPLPGHTAGHAGIAVHTDRAGPSTRATRISIAVSSMRIADAARRGFASTRR